MSQDAPFLEQIAADPDDDGPRMVYADWLEEQGDERAEFIRVQCALAASPHPNTRSGWTMAEARSVLEYRRGMLQREKRLLARHGDTWRGAIRGSSVRATLRRGFVDELRTNALDLAAIAPSLSIDAPALRVLHVKPDSGRARLTPAIDAVERQQLPAGLRVLDVASCELDARELARLLHWPWLARLTRLSLAWNSWLGGLASDWLDGQWPLAELEQLDLRGITLTREASEMLVTSPALRQLLLLTISRRPRRAYLQLREVFGSRLLAI